MSGSIGSCLRVGVATLTAAAVMAIPPTAPAAAPAGPTAVAAQVQPAPRVELAAAVRSLLTTPPNPAHFADATAAMARLDPAGTSAAVDAPATFNAASDAIVAGYQFLRYWVTYGVQLADYVLGFVPFGYAIADQVNIFYYNLILPISDSVVYNLIVPVVNDPLNPASWVNGLAAVGQTSVNAVINTAVAEFNYFFGWLIPPLPPRPLVAAARTVAPDAAVTTLATEVDATTEPTKTPEPTKAPEPSKTSEPVTTPAVSETPASETPEPTKTPEPSETPEPSTTPAPSETPEPTETPKPATTTSVGGVQAQGEVRGGTQVTTPTGSTNTGSTNTKTPTSTDPKPPTTTDTTTTTTSATSTSATTTGTSPTAPDTDTKKDPAKSAGES